METENRLFAPWTFRSEAASRASVGEIGFAEPVGDRAGGLSRAGGSVGRSRATVGGGVFSPGAGGGIGRSRFVTGGSRRPRAMIGVLARSWIARGGGRPTPAASVRAASSAV